METEVRSQTFQFCITNFPDFARSPFLTGLNLVEMSRNGGLYKAAASILLDPRIVLNVSHMRVAYRWLKYADNKVW